MNPSDILPAVLDRLDAGETGSLFHVQLARNPEQDICQLNSRTVLACAHQQFAFRHQAQLERSDWRTLGNALLC
jgi:hypothetical protein